MMAKTRYGRIYHGDHHHNNIKFPSPDAREKFALEFERYHLGHEHDGEVPRFEMLKAADLKSYERGPKDHDEMTIDGYTSGEIHEYHNRVFPDTYTHYEPPTCCVSPIIVVDREFIDSGTLERHELSSIFGDMPYEEFEHLVRSIEQDGFMDPLIRMHEGKVLDGWHRYAAALALNLVRKLRFMNWDEEKEGAAVAFVAARNIERRHLSASQRAQIVVSLNGRFGWGGDRSKETNVHLKTHEALAAQANVSTKTIQRAEKVEKAGRSEEVIAGEKSSSEVITEETVKSLWEQVTAEMKPWKQRDKAKCKYESDYISRASKSMLITALRLSNHSDEDGETTLAELKQILELMKEDCFSFISYVRQVLKADSQPTESEPKPTADDRDAAKLLKQKQQALKSMWDTRIQAARDWAGEADTELNQYLSLPELEQGFQENNPSYAADFASAMTRTSEQRYEIMVGKVLDSDVALEVLQREARALTTYAGDIRMWQRPDWSPDTNWIRPLIEKKKEAEAKKADPEPEPESDPVETLWEQVTAEMEGWKQRNTTHVTNLTHVTKDHILKAYRYCYGDRNREGEATAEELSAILESLIEGHLPLVLGAEQASRNARERAQREPESNPVESLWEQVTAEMPKWKQRYTDSGYRESELVSIVGTSKLIVALRMYRNSAEQGVATEAELKDLLDLMKSQSYPLARAVRKVLGGLKSVEKQETAAAEPSDTQASDQTPAETPETCPVSEPDSEALDTDTSLVDLNLPALKSFLESVLYHVGDVEDPSDRDNLSVAIYEVFEQFEDITERKMLSILIDCAHSIVSETEAHA